ncbi:MAG: hypothetical protein N2049_09145 [Anaerolineales bacterium]|nr:hypothetical protein [Anaerolineales bacterium]MCX7609366.1 hypothetical protein [Anaerolineales bacterium]MDW8227661.1 hypothetical protein [Anaerolineales bacterium]
MTIDDAVQALTTLIKQVSPSAEVKTVKISEEEARMSVFVGEADVQAIREATFQPVLKYLNEEGYDIQVLVYDKDHPPEIGD